MPAHPSTFNPQLLFKHFDTLADTPEAVDKLRKLVLDLAIRGSLVPQNPSDAPARSLVERAKAELGKKRQVKSSAAPTNAEEAPPFPLTKNWCWTCLDELGDTAPRNEVPDKTEVGFSPMRLVTVKFGEPIAFERRPWSEVRKGFTHFADGDVVVAKITPCFENGKSGVIRNAPNGVGAGTTELHVFRPVPNCVLPDYALAFLKSPHFLRNGEQHMTGSAGQKRVPWDYFARTPFPLPPLAEQRRIVAKVEELLALCDALEARQTTAREHRARLVHSALDHLTTAQDEAEFRKHAHFILHRAPFILEDVPAIRQAILSLAVQGRLVRQNPKEEPAPTLLARIRSIKRRLAESSGTKPPKDWPPVEDEELAFSLPENWAATRLGNLAVSIEAGSSPQCEGRRKTENEWGVLKISAVSWDSFDPDENKALPANVEPRPEYEVQDGDFIMSRANTAELVAKSVVANNPPPRLLLNDKTLRVRFTEQTDKRFLNMLNNSSVSRAYYAKAASGTSSSMKNISREGISMLPIALPPLAEQQRIVAKVNELLRWCDQLEAHLTTAQTSATHLLDATLRQLLAA